MSLISGNVQIRSATDSDIAPLVACLAPAPARAQIVNRFTEQRAGLRILLVMELEAELVGTVSYDPKGDQDGVTHRLFALDVGVEFRRRGFATRLIAEVEKRIKSDGQSIVRLDVAENNPGAISLYENLGYERVAEPRELKWYRQTAVQPTEVVTETSYRMLKRLLG